MLDRNGLRNKGETQDSDEKEQLVKAGNDNGHGMGVCTPGVPPTTMVVVLVSKNGTTTLEDR